MHLCVGQPLVSTLITMSIPMPYAVAVTNPSVTCRSIFDKYSPAAENGHSWSAHETQEASDSAILLLTESRNLTL